MSDATRLWSTGLCVLLLSGVVSAQSVIRVDADAVGANDGTSWADAFLFLQDGLGAAAAGDQVWVAEGTYAPDRGAGFILGEPNQSFQLVAGVEHYGGFDGSELTLGERDPDTHVTILSGDLLGDDIPAEYPDGPSYSDNARHVVSGSLVGNDTVLDGFTITGGNGGGGAGMVNADGSPTVVGCTFHRNTNLSNGGAVSNTSPTQPHTTPRFVDCDFTENSAANGGAVYANLSDSEFVDCTFDLNFSRAGANGEGGAVKIQAQAFGGPYSMPVFQGCVFTNNTAGYGGALALFDAEAVVTDCQFSGNTTVGQPVFLVDAGGGAVLLDGSGSSAFVDCTFTGNTSATSNGAVGQGTASVSTFTRCTFTGNEAFDGDGGAIGVVITSMGVGSDFESCEFTDNVASGIGGAVNGFNSLVSCIFTSNDAANGGAGTGGGTVASCVFRDNTATGAGGALLNARTVTGSLFETNVAGGDGGAGTRGEWFRCRFVGNMAGGVGGALDVDGGPANDVVSCEFIGNQAQSGGALRVNVAFQLVNCTLVGNTATADGGGLLVEELIGKSIHNSILWGNVDAGGIDESAQLHIDITATDPLITYTTVEGWTSTLPATQSDGVDPLFLDPLGPDVTAGTIDDNHRLSASSPAIDFGDSDAAAGQSTDVAGQPRFVDDEETRDMGAGMLPIVDRGAYEYQDCNDNDVPDTLDVGTTSQDCNGNLVPDECDISAGTSADCNSNGIPDECDIALGTSDDCNANGIPDECEPDCNSNGLPDACDITAGTSQDCNGNGIPDECDIASGTSQDCNTNGIPDECDFAVGTSLDCDGNGVPDECDPDCNSNGTPDACDITAGSSQDCNGNGVPDECDITSGTSLDCNTNGVPDACDIAVGTSQDCNGNGVPDECEPDCNGNSIPDACDITSGTSEDCNGNGVPDECDIVGGGSEDCNANGIPDECELDCNDNDVPDDCDISLGTSLDCNSNGVPDECETDCNGNGVPDDCDIALGTSLDCNGNGVPDECDVLSGASTDVNGNGTPDECEPGFVEDCNGNRVPDLFDVVLGTSPDCNGNGLPDECELLPVYGAASDALGPLQGGSTLTFVLAGALPAQPGTLVSLRFVAIGDLDSVSERIDVEVGGAPLGSVFVAGAGDCSGDGDTASLSMSAASFNGLLPGDVVIDLKPSTAVDAAACPDSNVTVIVEYVVDLGAVDCDGNGVPDACDLDCDGNGTPDACDIAADGNLDLDGNGVIDTCEASAQDVVMNQTVVINPDGGGEDLVQEALVELTNASRTATNETSVIEVQGDLHPTAGAFGALGTSLIVETDLADGDFSMMIVVPFDAAGLAGRDPLAVKLVYYDAGTDEWTLAVAGNTVSSPGHPGPIGDEHLLQDVFPQPVLGDALFADLGDYGVWWNSGAGMGFAWANVDHTTDFAAGIINEGADCNGNDVPDDQDLAGGSSTDGNANGIPDECETCQQDLGFAGPGQGVLSICGDDLSQFGSAATFSITGAAPNAQVLLFVGLVNAPTSVQGGVLVPVPWVTLIDFLSTNGDGSIVFPFAGNGGTPVTVFIQAVVKNGRVFEFTNAIAMSIGI